MTAKHCRRHFFQKILRKKTRTVYKANLTTVGSITPRSYFTPNVCPGWALFALSFLHPSYSRVFMAVIRPYKVEKGNCASHATEEGDSKWRLIFLTMLLPSVLHLRVLFISRNVHSLYSKWLYVICTIVVCREVRGSIC